MKNSFKKLFFYELKKMKIFSLTCLILIFICNVVSYAIYSQLPIIVVQCFDRTKIIFLYLFMIYQIIYLLFRSFADRNLFDYMHISPEKVFCVRLLLHFSLTAIFTLFLLLVGTSSLEVIKFFNPESFTGFRNNLMFTFQGKNSWYFMFCLNNAFFIALIFCFINIIQNIVFCKRSIIFKIIWLALIVIIILGVSRLSQLDIIFYSFLPYDIFKISVPLDYYDYYNLFGMYKYKVNMYFYKEPCVLGFILTFNILSLMNLATMIVLGYLSFTSNSFFEIKNKKPEKQLDDFIKDFGGKYYDWIS